MPGRITLFDEWALRKSVCLRNPLVTRIMQLITHSGSGLVWFGLTFIFIVLYESGIRTTNDFLTLISCMFGAFISLIAGQILKRIFNRPRPEAAITQHRALVETPQDGSFPSTHTSTSVALALGLILAGHMLAPYIVIWSAGVAFSRYYLGVHYPSDIAAGALLGLVCGAFDYSSVVSAIL